MSFDKMNLYDYLVYCNGERSDYKLVEVITRQQSVMEIKEKKDFDHWDILREIHKKIYPSREVDDSNMFSDSIVLFSEGNDLTISIPNEVNNEQFYMLKYNLRNARAFEYDYDRFLFMPYDSRELIEDAKKKVKEDLSLDEDEVIIGTQLEKDDIDTLRK